MFKILIIYKINTMNTAAVSTEVVSFDTKQEANTALKKVNEAASYELKAVALY